MKTNKKPIEQETKESTGAGGGASSGAFEEPFMKPTQTNENTDLEEIEEIIGKKLETEIGESTSVGSVGSGGQGSGFAYINPYGTWAKNEKSMRHGKKTLYPGGSFVTVKKKCQKFPYCNQGDTGALNFSKSLGENIEKAETDDIYIKENKIMGTANKLKEYEKQLFNHILKEGQYGDFFDPNSKDTIYGDETTEPTYEKDYGLEEVDTEMEYQVKERPQVPGMTFIAKEVARQIRDKVGIFPQEEKIFDMLLDLGYTAGDNGVLFNDVKDELTKMGVSINTDGDGLYEVKKKKDKKWIQKAVDPKHEGFCTPETKKTCTPKRKALAKTLKKMAKEKVKESKDPGISLYKSIHDKSGVTNKEGVKLQMDNAARLNKVSDQTEEQKLSGIGKGEPKYPNFDKTVTNKQEDYTEMLRGYGLQDLNYDTEPSESFKERAEEAIEGSARMGNSPDYANAMRDFDGNKGELGKQVVDIAKRKKEVIDKGNEEEDRFGLKYKYPKKQGEVNLATEGTLKNLKTKRVIYYEKDLQKLIPESHKVEGGNFKLTDGNSTVFNLKWELGSLIVESEKNQIIEESELNKSKKLMGYSVGSYKVKPKGMIN